MTGKCLISCLTAVFTCILLVWASEPASARAVVIPPGASVEEVEADARYLISNEANELTYEQAKLAYEAGEFADELETVKSDAFHDWRVWIALPFIGGGESNNPEMRRIIGLGGIFVEPPRVYLSCEGRDAEEILASKSGDGQPLSPRYFTYLRTQSFGIAPGQNCLALINVASTDSPSIGVFREGELGTNQVVAVLLKGSFSATLLIIGLILAIVSYLTDRPLGVLIGVAYSMTMLQNEASLLTTTFVASPLTARAVWEGVTILSTFTMTYVFLFGFRKELRLTNTGRRRLVALLLVAPVIFIAYRSNSTPDIIWAFYLSGILFAVTVAARFDIAQDLRFAAGGILMFCALAAIFLEPYYFGRYLPDLAIEFFRDTVRLAAGIGMLALLLVDVLQSRRARGLLIEERIEALEKQSETDRILLKTERSYARARETASRRKAQLAAASHDIRQPLIGLRAALRTEEGKLSHGLKLKLDDAIDYLESLTNEYSDRNVGDDDERHPQDEAYSLSLITSAVGKMFTDEAREAGVEFTVECAECQTRIPALALIRATSNLVANSLRHAEASKISLAVSCDDRCRIVVADNGKGMDATTLELVLQAGQKSPTSDGDGLGLAIVGELADRYGVDLTVDSSPGRGTRTVLTLPAD